MKSCDKKFIIFAPPYDENVGGSIVLHKLCHVLNELGCDAKLYPYFENFIFNKMNFPSVFFKFLKYLLAGMRSYRINPNFNAPLFKGALGPDSVVIYPEVVSGNPLEAENVVRWFLHRPGFHTGVAAFGVGELYFDFNDFVVGMNIPGSHLSSAKLTVTHFPLDQYNMTGALSMEQREGFAYCVRKGKAKFRSDFLPVGAICIDGMAHADVAALFKTVKRFISFDSNTAYSYFAALCGAESVVVPDVGVPKNLWHADPRNCYGVAYGEEDLAYAVSSVGKLKDYFEELERESVNRVRDFVREVDAFFVRAI